MNIHLTDKDIAQMPESGRTWFLNWLPEHLKPKSLEFEHSKEILILGLNRAEVVGKLWIIQHKNIKRLTKKE